MRIEAVTVCVDYSDFFGETLKQNRGLIDHWVVVTRPEDVNTIELCRKWNLQCITSSEFGRDGQPFNKGRGIALGLAHLATSDWVLHLDADVVLPPQTRQMLEVADLDKTCLYGIDRINVTSWDEWQAMLKSGYPHSQHGYHLCCNFPQPAKIGTRVVRGRFGYVPIGFFQLWWGGEGIHAGMRWKDYPDTNSDAAHSDIKFALHWDRAKRVLLPEIVAVHLESEPLPFGSNWKGRKSKQFGPPIADANSRHPKRPPPHHHPEPPPHHGGYHPDPPPHHHHPEPPHHHHPEPPHRHHR